MSKSESNTMSEAAAEDLLQSLNDLVGGIISIEDFKLYKKECSQLTRRVKLLVPFFEEVRELKGPLGQESVTSFEDIASAFKDARQLLHQCHNGSKIYLLLERETFANRFQAITTAMAHALDGIPFEKLEISDEVREQVELVHAQLKRAKGRFDMQDIKVYEDIMITLLHRCDRDTDHAILERLAESLHLRTVSELKQESQALQNLILEHVGESNDTIEKVSCVLRKLKAIAVIDNPESDTPYLEMARLTVGAPTDKLSPPMIPDDFRCPISLELMRDPVIVATGQTYERACIQKWLDAGHKTCPKTQQVLPHLILTPNYVLRSLISQWCETHGIVLPQQVGSSRGGKSASNGSEVSHGDRDNIAVLVQNLASGQTDLQRAAAGELRLLAKRSIENRVCIAEAGAISLLVALLSTTDIQTQEHAVTALLNLSINDNNKGQIVLAGAINPIVEVLRGGSMEARENAAATLFSLSVVDENKVTIGMSGAIPALVELLRDGSPRGKKDAATALFNLSIYQGNKGRAVRAGVVPHLMNLLVDPNLGMVDEALAILAILATHAEGRLAIGNSTAIPVLVELINSGSPRNKENAASILLALSVHDSAHLVAAQQLGAYEPLTELAQNGTVRARRKATALLEHMMMKHEYNNTENL
ncbi:hypothetical protein O6H91_18G037500 [Diphasiastrum complanatum]|uniref:Uncharacterized protein n=1 Tax=Diphasiastrum complanatum TaxID=34168 RepID=A0ACC2AZY1_DIPCM|nr:hypothetical protein O6H91_18G037500 [Diphasiastrum complanatum]